MRETIYHVSLSIFFTLVPAGIFAQESAGEVRQGMGFYDVAKVWGRPLEKRQQESHREEVWLYPDAKVIFQDGKVAAWTKGSTRKSREALAPTAAPNPASREKMEQILGEILHDLP